jgi:subtilisin family serine protease
VGRRLLAVVALALALCGSATAAATRSASDPLEPQEWWLAAVGADPAQAPGPGVPIAIIDSGTDPTHPEFANRPNTTFSGPQTVDGPQEFHGTMVASIAAAPENGVGIVGVYPNAALELYDASPQGQISNLDVVTDLDAAAQHCPAVINLSFGGVTPDPAVYDEILKAVHNGCLVVAASGNQGEQGNPPTFPAEWPHVLTVSATDQTGMVAPFSTMSTATDLAAPGVGIIGAVPLSHNPSGYESHDGTSFSAPIVSAAAAWVWTVRSTLDAGQVADVLRAGAHDIPPAGFDSSSGYGLLNIPGALAAPTPPVDPSEPNDDIDQVKPHAMFPDGEPALTTPARPSGRIAASLDVEEDPRDIYRIWVPAHRTVHARVTSGSRLAAARIWGPKTVSIDEGLFARRRDLKGPSITAGAQGFAAYVEVLPTGASERARYVLSVTAAKR